VASASSTAWFDDAPPPTPVSGQAIAAMDWDALQAAAARCTRCELCRTRTSVVFGRGDHDAGWLMVGSAPSRIDEKEGRAVAGEAGQLLDNMLRAIGLGPERDVYVTSLVKCRVPDAARGPTPEQLAACRPYLERELALTQARTIVTLGQPAAAGLLGPQDAARGVLRRLGASAVVATYHPDDLLRRSASKAGAWADLCLAKGAHGTES
jgi:uracil-DNA glycosylase family 4